MKPEKTAGPNKAELDYLQALLGALAGDAAIGVMGDDHVVVTCGSSTLTLEQQYDGLGWGWAVLKVKEPRDWVTACRELVTEMFIRRVDALESTFLNPEEEEPVGGLDPSTPEGWDDSTGKE